MDEIEMMVQRLAAHQITVEQAQDIVRRYGAPPQSTRTPDGDIPDDVDNDMSTVTYAFTQGKITADDKRALFDAWYEAQNMKVPGSV